MRSYKLTKCQPLRVDQRVIKHMMYTYTAAQMEAKIAAITDDSMRKEARRISRLAYVG